MDPEKLAQQLAFLAADDNPAVQEQARAYLETLNGYQNNPLVNTSPESFGTQIGQVLSAYGQLAGRIGGTVAQLLEKIPARPADTFAGAGVDDVVNAVPGQIQAGVQTLGDLLNPQGAAERFIAEQQAGQQDAQLLAQQQALALGQAPALYAGQGTGGLLDPNAPGQQAPLYSGQGTGGYEVPLPGLGPDIQQQAAAAAANQAGALNALNQQEQLVSQLQLQRLQYVVQQEQLNREREMLGLLQVPQGNPNALGNAAAFSQAPAVGLGPNNLTSLLPQQQSIGSVNLPSTLAATQTNINQRQRTARIEQPFVNASVQQQERALELARQQYIDNVANKVFKGPR